MKDMKTTIIGALLAGMQAVMALADLSNLPPKIIAIRFGLAAGTFLLGVIAKDWDHSDAGGTKV